MKAFEAIKEARTHNALTHGAFRTNEHGTCVYIEENEDQDECVIHMGNKAVKLPSSVIESTDEHSFDDFIPVSNFVYEA